MALTSFEEQEINEIKSWWSENYKTIIAVLILALAGSWGWHYWQAHQVNKAQAMSTEYDNIILSNHSVDIKNAEIDIFVKDNSKTAYATLALLEKAKVATEAKDYSLAATALQQAIQESPDEILASLAAIRLANVQIQLKDTDAALATLNQVKDPTWEARKLLLIGDIQATKGDKTAAQTSYEQAQKNSTPLEQQWLQVRLNNL
ncbi:chaperone protein HscA /co-chaperone protein HscB [Pasteurella langaaensis DSM 22999]|uniref:Ancillary SecYEG translocon subunit n=1 Tax=Alitibacter langaaensis DSM 22999 TaxID=1122935 RepID=A0A2U0T5C3_9PAST|nr:YfgM family protein [Pasteurella langaaensis]PVX38793.1 chaperone protein HscA /co-chaperone protein HscB [Pasteurella langaaensis DSM 22999]